ncbi:hypothetical protein QR685DRAFT_585172 [Neurospora intermedia]|uniref:Secreted protein n=1 Tax=Neurospora intermedia TaxID=5142 RepID=A0ABR3DID4_NEUIN
MMSLFFVLSCFLLAMVSAATGSDRTVPPPTSSPSVANILVDGDKSVTLKVTTVTYISAKNSTTVVPILTLSTVVVEEIAQESVAVLNVSASPASETASVPTPLVSKLGVFLIVRGRGQAQKELMFTVCEDSQAASLHAWQSGQQPGHFAVCRAVGDGVLGGTTIAALDVDSRHVSNQTSLADNRLDYQSNIQ